MPHFESLLIANRGEIACRVMRTAQRLGIRTIAVYSQADREALHVRRADAAACIGPPAPKESYLHVERMVDAIRDTGAGAVHPGYGFLSENADFAQAVADAGAVFVGPSARAIRAMGSKIEAKRVVEAAGTPVVPGYHGDDQTAETLAREAERIGYPLLVKASAGGGGRGMRAVNGPDELEAALTGGRREALAAFGDDAVLLERYLSAPKHIEVQILADGAGKTLFLFERDCSVQRRHQKVIEEAPGPTVSAELRRAIGEAAVRAAKAVDYVGAGTVEFVVEGDDFYFLEMNTRLQVEHPVTEAILGLDLVEWQIRIAAGEALPFSQGSLAIDGHAVEVRIYAEQPRRRFLPSTGTLRRFSFGDGVRVDSGVAEGSSVTPHYDPMLAKVIARGPTRQEAVRTLRTALEASQIAGVEHNVPWLLGLLATPSFEQGDYTTALVEEAGNVGADHDAVATAAGVACAVLSQDGTSPWARGDGFQINLPRVQTLRFRRGRRDCEARVEFVDDALVVDGPEGRHTLQDVEQDGETFAARFNGGPRTVVTVLFHDGGIDVLRNGGTERLRLLAPDAGTFGRAMRAGGQVVAPLPGRIVAVHVQPGDKVRAEQPLLVLEAMKMEHTVRAPAQGVVTAVRCQVDDRVQEGVELLAIE